MDKHYYTSKFRIADLSDEEGRFSGYAAVFNELIPSYNEIVDPGAFAQTLSHNDGKVPVLWMHGPGLFSLDRPPIGMGQSGKEDHHGLFVEAKLDLENHQLAREVWGFMKLAREVNRKIGLSIGFTPMKQIVSDDRDVPTHVTEARLWEYSPTPPDWQAAPNAGINEMHSQYQSKMHSMVVSILDELGIKSPALEAARATQGATDISEAQLHSLNEELFRTVDKFTKLTGRTP